MSKIQGKTPSVGSFCNFIVFPCKGCTD